MHEIYKVQESVVLFIIMLFKVKWFLDEILQGDHSFDNYCSAMVTLPSESMDVLIS